MSKPTVQSAMTQYFAAHRRFRVADLVRAIRAWLRILVTRSGRLTC